MKTETLLQQQLEQLYPYLREKDFLDLVGAARVLKLKNREEIQYPGTTHPILYFVISGAIRGYFQDELQEEKILFLSLPSCFGGNPHEVQDSNPSIMVFEAMGKTEVISFNPMLLRILALQNGTISQFLTDVLININMTLAGRISLISTKRPETRVRKLSEKFPELMQIIPGKYVANFIGITPNSLSRIKSRMRTVI
ncbi:MAG: Crp/Fnr family transcriptional regulator [Saprospiraceae bacterium]|nr:Crp/Fnr family transcriptional regulator [Saprospiraceae bacterium]